MALEARRPGRSSLGLTLSVGLVLLFVVGVVFSVSRSTSAIVSDADALHDADEALRSVTVVRAQIELVALQSAVKANPTPQEREAIQTGLESAEDALSTAHTGIEAMAAHDGTSSGLVVLAENFSESALQAIAAIESGANPDLEDFRRNATSLIVEVAGTRTILANAVTDADRGLTSLGWMASFLVAFVLPAGVMIVDRDLSQRHTRQQELEVHLDAER